MPTVTLEEAQTRLPELIHRLHLGDELIIMENNQPVATLSRTKPSPSWPCKAGSAKGKIRMSPDFDQPIEGFEEYAD